MTFVNLTKALNTVSRDGLWKIMAKFWCPPLLVAVVRQFHNGMQARGQNDQPAHYVNIPLQYTAIFHGCKNDNLG